MDRSAIVARYLDRVGVDDARLVRRGLCLGLRFLFARDGSGRGGHFEGEGGFPFLVEGLLFHAAGGCATGEEQQRQRGQQGKGACHGGTMPQAQRSARQARQKKRGTEVPRSRH